MRGALTLIAGVVLLASAGCGDSGGVSKDDFISEADAICEPFDDRYNQLNDQIVSSADLPDTPANNQALAALEYRQADLIDEAVRRLEALEPPGR
jgi:hypothetical protein